MSTDSSTQAQQRRGYPPLSDLRRSRTDRHVAGVAGGLGRYAGIDPLVFRILFVVLAIFGGSGILLYALGWLLIPEEGETESEGQRLMNGRSPRSKRSVLALVIVIVIAVLATGAFIDSGPGIGGLGLLAVIGAAAVLLLRNGQRDASPAQGPVHGPVPPPAEPGAYGQTPGTAYATAAPPPQAAAPDPHTATFARPPGTTPPPQTATFAPPPPQTATFAPPPSGPTYPVYAPPPPPAPPKERSILGRVTLSTALIVVGLLVGWNAATDSDVPSRIVIAVALGVVGLGLVVGAVAGRARGLVIWGILLTALATVAAVVPDVPVNGGIGDRTWRPTTVDQLRHPYRLGIGDAELDLSRLDLTGLSGQRINVRQGVGDLTVVIPDDVVVRIAADVQAGEIRVPGIEPTDGTDLSERVVVPQGSSAGDAVLVVDAELGLGSLEVRRAAA